MNFYNAFVLLNKLTTWVILLLSVIILTAAEKSISYIDSEQIFHRKFWPVGTNFVPSTAVNQLEMWQVSSFDPQTIDKELGYAERIGMNTMRVYFHHLVWQQDNTGFKKRISHFLQIADKHGIKIMFVFFDDCWNDRYCSGQQPSPIPGVHNSRWVKDPGSLIDLEPKLMDTLENYVKDILRTFRNDRRILAWDLYNEPGHFGRGIKSWPLLRNVVRWAREIQPSQPITIGLYNPKFAEMNRFQLENSDIISFHNYADTFSLKRALDTLTGRGKPVICTEYMKRTTGSTFENCLPILRRYGVGAINWGLVAGKTQTNYPQGNKRRTKEPQVWYHDILRKDGTPFSMAETELIRQMTLNDGPYLFYDYKDNPTVRIIESGCLKIKSLKGGAVNVSLPGRSDWGFTVNIRKHLTLEPSTWKDAKKIFLVSDIEGEFVALRSLLIANKIIDEKYNWTFGKGHLVIDGDLFDRGKEVVQELWLIYKLEDEARKAGGHVHTILGNHDIMNLSGDYRYVDEKYFTAAKIMGMDYSVLYGKNSELGCWLRTKNGMEKIGMKLFIHGGVSPAVNAMNVSVEDINRTCRQHYGIPRKEIPKAYQDLFNQNALFWYRGYFMEPRAARETVDSTLRLFGVKQIVVGHTIIKNRNPAPYYCGKVLGVDVNMHEGQRAAVLIEGDRCYFVDNKGHCLPLAYQAENDQISENDID